MRSFTKMMCVLLALILALVCLPMATLATDASVIASGTCGANVTWELTDDGTLTISGEGAMEDFPSVGKIAWWRYHDSITSVIIEDGVTHIGNDALHSCSNLTEITIPDSVTSIGSSVFSSCTSLTKISIPNSVTSIGWGLFTYCTSLTEVTLPDGVSNIGNCMFQNCTSLASITIPAGVTRIGTNAFTGCPALTEVIFKGDAPSIENYAFTGVTTTVYYPVGNDTWSQGVQKNYKGNLTWRAMGEDGTVYLGAGFCGENLYWTLSMDGVLTVYGEGEMEFEYFRCPWEEQKDSITTVVVEPGVTSILYSAFYECTNLTSVTLPGTITEIGTEAFASCPALTTFNAPSHIDNVATGAFSKSTALPADENGFVIMYDILVAYKGTAEAPVIPENVKRIGSYAFAENQTITGVTIHDDVTTIGWSAFEGCTSLSEVQIPAGVTLIDDNAFYGCKSLKTVTIPDGVTTVDSFAFGECGLTYAEFAGAPDLGYGIFEGCQDLTAIKFLGTSINPGYGAFNAPNATAYYPAWLWREGTTEGYGYINSGVKEWVPYEQVAEDVTYEILDGANSVVDTGKNESLTIRASGELSKFKEVQVDGTVVDSSNYTVSEGSTIVTFSADYLKTLSEGEHMVKIIFSDGEVGTTLTIEASKPDQPEKPEKPEQPEKPEKPEQEENPKTGDAFGVLGLTVLLTGAAAATLFLSIKKKELL